MSKWALYNVVSLTLYFVLAFLLLTIVPKNLPSKGLILGLLASWMMFMIGIQIVHFQFKKGQFINRFLTATVFQILAFLSLAVYLIFMGFQPAKPLLLSIVVTHMLGLLIQTIFFLRFAKTIE